MGAVDYVYILATRRNGTLYTGVTNDLKRRAWQHRSKLIAGFTTRYGVDQLVYFEPFRDISSAIAREKQIKAGSRRAKLRLIERENPDWRDLSASCSTVLALKPILSSRGRQRRPWRSSSAVTSSL